MWGSIPALETLASISFWVGVVSGGIALIAGAALTITSDRIAVLTKTDADVRITDADARAVEAKREAAEANARAEEAKAEAEKARLEALKLQEALSWRELSTEQEAAFVVALSDKLGKVWNTYVGSDPEAARLREQFEGAFRRAGVETAYFRGWEQAAGISVLGEKTDAREALSNALAAAGIPHELKPPHGGIGRDFPALLVGTKHERL